MKAARLAPSARRDLLEAVGWIAGDNRSAAIALRESVMAAALRIAESPMIGRERPDLADPPARFLVLRGFPYVIVYDADERPPLILRVLHGARDLPAALEDI